MNGVGGDERQGGRHRPTTALVKDSIDLSDDYDIFSTTAAMADKRDGLPMFGPYLKKKRREQAGSAAADIIIRSLIKSNIPKQNPEPAGTVSAPKEANNGVVPAVSTPVELVVGRALKTVGAYKSLDRRAQVVALVNEVSMRVIFPPLINQITLGEL